MSEKLKSYVKAILAGTAVFGALIVFFISGAEEMPPLTGSMKNFTVNPKVVSAPAVSFQDAEGNEKTFEDFDDRVLLINFWATWCAPCLKELPSLLRLQKAMGDNNFSVLAISTDLKGAEAALPYFEKHGLEGLPLFFDPEMKLARAFGVKSLPTTVLLNKRGTFVGALAGLAEWDDEAAKTLIEYFKQR